MAVLITAIMMAMQAHGHDRSQHCSHLITTHVEPAVLKHRRVLPEQAWPSARVLSFCCTRLYLL